MEYQHISRDEAARMVEHRDYEHEAYLRRHYGSHQERPELYHLLINTGLFPFDLAARLIQEALPLVGAFVSAAEASETALTPDATDTVEAAGTTNAAETTEAQES